MEITHGALEKESSQCRKNGIAQVAMKRRHGPRLDTAAKAVSYDQAGAVPQLFDEPRNMPKLIAIVGIPHHDVLAGGGGDASHERAAIAFGLNAHDLCTKTLGNLNRTVGAAVIANDNLAHDICRLNCRLCLLDALAYGLCLVQAGHHDRQFDRHRFHAVSSCRKIGWNGFRYSGQYRVSAQNTIEKRRQPNDTKCTSDNNSRIAERPRYDCYRVWFPSQLAS